MKLTLIYPRFPDPDNTYKAPPLSLASLAAYAREHFQGALDVAILDASALNLSVEETLARLVADPPDVLGISLMTPQADFAYALTRLAKTLPQKPLILHGGVHATVLPQQSLEVGADYCVLGEGEVTLLEILTALQAGGSLDAIAGLAYMAQGELVRTPPRPFIEDLEQIPLPAWDLLDHELYNENIHVMPGYALPVMGSRGCPHDCDFCASAAMWQRRVRFRDPSSVVEELLENMMAYGTSNFHFYDDNFLLKRSWVEAFCQELEQVAVCNWVCLTRAADINRNADLLPLMKRAGCCGFEIGMESGDEEVLQQINKQQNLAEVEAAFLKIAEAGFPFLGIQLMTFNEGETVAGQRRQAVFLSQQLEKLAPYNIHTSIENRPPFLGQFATPYPGTRFYDSAPQTGRVLAQHWSDYKTSRLNYVPHTLAEPTVYLTRQIEAAEFERLTEICQHYVFSWPDYPRRTVPQLPEILQRLAVLLADGTVLAQIAAAIHAEFEISEYLATKFAAVSIVAGSQMGFIATRGNV